jgi:dihydroneopterin aldolase
MDRIRLTGMRFYGYHGCFPEESRLGQAFLVDLELDVDLRAAGTQDNLALTVDYGKVYGTVKEIVEGAPFKLIEAVAERVAGQVLAQYRGVQAVTVRVHKPNAPIPGPIDGVTVELHRRRGE